TTGAGVGPTAVPALTPPLRPPARKLVAQPAWIRVNTAAVSISSLVRITVSPGRKGGRWGQAADAGGLTATAMPERGAGRRETVSVVPAAGPGGRVDPVMLTKRPEHPPRTRGMLLHPAGKPASAALRGPLPGPVGQQDRTSRHPDCSVLLQTV